MFSFRCLSVAALTPRHSRSHLAALAGLRVRSWAAAVLHMLLLCGIFAAAQLAAEAALGPPSRRLVNLPYILAMVSEGGG